MFRAAFRRLLAIDDPPERTALAFSVGVFIAFSPFLGLHTIMATVVAFAFRFNKVAIYSGTFVNNPVLTLVPITVVSYALGAFVTGRPLALPAEGLELLSRPRPFHSSYWGALGAHAWDVVVPFSVGASILSVVCSLATYPVTLHLLRARMRRRAAKNSE
ncbi:MAG TPA: DUF2062 domain-containing protein [Pyrinomonadaceae bacterium]|nr:DUF2062 domain-containing protein [Pyrinomonadaceae bacterium]